MPWNAPTVSWNAPLSFKVGRDASGPRSCFFSGNPEVPFLLRCPTWELRFLFAFAFWRRGAALRARPREHLSGAGESGQCLWPRGQLPGAQSRGCRSVWAMAGIQAECRGPNSSLCLRVVFLLCVFRLVFLFSCGTSSSALLFVFMLDAKFQAFLSLPPRMPCLAAHLGRQGKPPCFWFEGSQVLQLPKSFERGPAAAAAAGPRHQGSRASPFWGVQLGVAFLRWASPS